MADQKLTQLTAITTPTTDDLLYIVDDPAGTPVSNKITIANAVRLSDANNNTFFGKTTLPALTTGVSNTAVGTSAGALITQGDYNVAMGANALDALTTGSNNIAIGVNALGAQTTANQNIAIGKDAAAAVTTASGVTAIGSNAYKNSTGFSNVAVGNGAIGTAVMTGSNNVAVGTDALTNSTSGILQTAVGSGALSACTTGTHNTGVGGNAGGSVTTGSENTLIGYDVSDALVDGANNTVVGSKAHTDATSGSDNTIIGYHAGYVLGTGSDNTFIGSEAGSTSTLADSNNIIIGSNANAGPGVSNRTVIGTASSTDSYIYGTMYIPAATTETRGINIGDGRTGDGVTYVDLVSDATYTDYGMRMARLGTGANAISQINHRGTGGLYLTSVDAGFLAFQTTNTIRGSVNSDGVLIWGNTGQTAYTTDQDTGTAFTPIVQVNDITHAASSIGLFNWSSSASIESLLTFSKSKSGTVGTRGIVASGDVVGAICFNGDDGVGFIQASKISAEIDGTPGVNDMPGRLVFSTTPDGGQTSTERLRITSGGETVVGGAAAYATDYPDGNQYTPMLQIQGTAASAGLGIYSWNNTSNTHPALTFSKSRSATIGSRSIVQNGDYLGGLNFTGDDGTNFVTAGSILGYVDGTPGSNDMPGRIVISTTADGAGTSTERLRISADGTVDVSGTLITDLVGSTGSLTHGTYTPTLTNVTNVTGSTAYVCQYLRVGNTVTVSGKFDMDITTTATQTELRMTLPIASNFDSDNDAGGSAISTASDAMAVYADGTNNTISFYGKPVTDVNVGYFFSFTYIVI